MRGADSVDHRADIYALGVVSYELLTGQLPIGKFAPPSQQVQIDVRLDEVVLRTLESEPARRYQRASEIKTDVDAISSTTGEKGPEVTRPHPPMRRQRVQQSLSSVLHKPRPLAGIMHVRELPKLFQLFLDGTHITDAAMVPIGALSGLRNLRLDRTQISDRGLQHLAGHVDMNLLSLNKTQITDAGVTHLAKMSRLDILGLGDTQVTDRAFDTIERMSQLRFLGLNGTQITDAGVERLATRTSLKQLFLGGIGVTDACLPKLQSLDLEWLSLLETSVTDDGLASIRQFKNLVLLRITSPLITDRGLEHIGDQAIERTLD